MNMKIMCSMTKQFPSKLNECAWSLKDTLNNVYYNFTHNSAKRKQSICPLTVKWVSKL